jgi:DNA-binding NtrC family response regulator
MQEQSLAQGAKYRILLVDDEEGVRFTLNKILKGAGHEVNTAAGLSEAYACLETSDFDIAIIDRMLSDGENGLDLLRFIRKSRPFCQTIMISAYPSFESAAKAAENGNFAYLIKPVRKGDILATITAAIKSIRKENIGQAV